VIDYHTNEEKSFQISEFFEGVLNWPDPLELGSVE
jgi:hypothetical protein